MTPTPAPLYSSLHADPSMAVLLRAYIVDAAAHAVALRADADAAHWELVRRRAHQLKGSGGSYGFPLVSQQAQALEQTILTHQPAPQSAPQPAPQIQSALTTLLITLHSLAAP